MPDPTPNDGFTIQLEQAELAVTQSLPAVADLLRTPVAQLNAFEWMGGTGIVPEAGTVQDTYHMFTGLLAHRQAKVSDVTVETAEALRDIVNLYRRVDGQA